MATRRPRAFCPICGVPLTFKVEHPTTLDNKKLGPTKWIMQAHACDPQKVQHFCEQQEDER